MTYASSIPFTKNMGENPAASFSSSTAELEGKRVQTIIDRKEVTFQKRLTAERDQMCDEYLSGNQG